MGGISFMSSLGPEFTVNCTAHEAQMVRRPPDPAVPTMLFYHRPLEFTKFAAQRCSLIWLRKLCLP